MPRRVLLRFVCLTLWLPLFALGSSKQIGEPDCKSLVSHSGFAEFVLSSEGGNHTLPIDAPQGAKWSIRNSAYVEWVEILGGDSGVGPGKLRIQLKANTGKYCRVGVLTISGLTRVYGLPITILQRGSEVATAEKQAQPSHPSVVNLTTFSGGSPQNARTREYRKITPKR